MARAFSEKEREHIRARLKDGTRECLGRFGVRKTTVDQLVERAGISKGAFYKFYPSKEVLFFSVLEDYQNYLVEKATARLDQQDTITREDFTEILYEIYRDVGQSFLMNLIKNQEFTYLIRKLPGELIKRHHSLDELLVQKLLARVKIKDDIDLGLAAASLRAVFMSMLHLKEIGEDYFDQVLKLLVQGLALQLVEGTPAHE
jgi:AcrR family transcriptional regulator